jgi:hypothetical protein
VNNWQII